MPAIDHAEAEYPIAKDPYPGRARVRRTGWYLRLPARTQIFISSIRSGSCGRALRRASTRLWMADAKAWAMIAARDSGDRVHVEVMEDVRQASWSRDRPMTRKERVKERQRKARKAYAEHRAARRESRAEIVELERVLDGETDTDERARLGAEIEALRVDRRAGFSRAYLDAPRAFVPFDPDDDIPF